MDSPNKTDATGNTDTAHVHGDESASKPPGGGEHAQFYVDDDSEGAPPAYQTGTCSCSEANTENIEWILFSFVYRPALPESDT